MPDLPLYLASGSPRRRQLLTEAGISFTLHVVPVDEDMLSAEYTGPLGQLGEYLARRKAVAAQESLLHMGKSGLVLASDTTVLIDGRSLPKPRDLDEAEEMLRTLRGREHIVATGIALARPAFSSEQATFRREPCPEPGQMRSATSATRVRMREYTDGEVAAYVATGDPLDKAGAYSIQHPAFSPVASITGCHLGVIGLPVCLVAALVNDAPLPPDAPESALRLDSVPRTAAAGGASRTGICPWSARCTPPFPGPDAVSERSPDASRT